jgi:hypothetical protein
VKEGNRSCVSETRLECAAGCPILAFFARVGVSDLDRAGLFLSRLRRLSIIGSTYPRLTPWAVFFRRCAANPA